MVTQFRGQGTGREGGREEELIEMPEKVLNLLTVKLPIGDSARADAPWGVIRQ